MEDQLAQENKPETTTAVSLDLSEDCTEMNICKRDYNVQCGGKLN